MADAVSRFYDGLAENYHLLFADWDASLVRQGRVLDALISEHLGSPPHRVLDASCGIGTQAIGLAQRGYTVHGTDISAAALARAEHEAGRLGVVLTTELADFRNLPAVAGTFDVVLSCDNALSHLLTDDDLRRAAVGLYARLRADGLLLVSIRDYDALLLQRPRTDLPRVFDRADGRQIVFQVWDWADDAPYYTVHQFLLRERREQERGREVAGAPAPGDQEKAAWTVQQETAVYRALRRAELDGILESVGFHSIAWHLPEATGFYQPILTARR